MKKRVLALILALACLVNAAPISVLATEIEDTAPVADAVIAAEAEEAADETEVSAAETTAPEADPTEEATAPVTEPEAIPPVNSCGENLTWTLDENGCLTISGTGEMTDFDSNTIVPWFEFRSSITDVVIEEGVTTIGNYAFAGYIGLKTVCFQGDAPAVIGSSAFAGVTATVSYPAGNPTWTEDILQSYGGALSWMPDCTNGHTYVTVVTPVTCLTGGYTTHTCSGCGSTYTDSYIAATGHNYVNGICSNCGSCLAAPKISIFNSTDGKIQLTWTASQEAVSYTVYRSASVNGPFIRIAVTSNADYTDTNVQVGQGYFYYVAAISADGAVSAPSTTVYGVCLPGSPTVSASNVASSGKICLTWEPVEGAVKYKVYRSSSKDSGYSLKFTTTSTRYTNTGAKAGDVYYYYVVAVSENGLESVASNTVKRVCDLPCPVVSVTNVAETGKVRLTWEPVEGAVEYRIYRSTSKNSGFKKVYTATGTTYTHTSGEPGVRYYYKVVAVHENSSANSAYSATISRICDCAKPVINAFTNEKGKIRVEWEPVEGAVSYKVYRCDTPNGTYKQVYTTSGTGYTNSGAQVGSIYYYKVKAVPSNTMGTSVFSTADYGRCVKNVYQYVYSRYSLTKSSTYARQTNLRLACEAINGTILAPGEEFSFNDIVGRRTEKKGYMVAGQVGGEGLGGGICQVSSVLFNAALLGNLKITKRWQHSVHPSYCPKGRDAMIYGTSNNLRFLNDTDYYIKIQAKANGGTVTITFLTREAGVSPASDVKLKVTKTGSNTYTLTRTFQGVVNYTATSTYVG